MAHFAVIQGEKEWLIKTDQVEIKVRTLIEAAGHTCVTWRPETAVMSLDCFVREVLLVREPVALVYIGHGNRGVWGYSTKRSSLNPGTFSYTTLAKYIAELRRGIPTAIINECCYSGSLADSIKQVGFDKNNLILLTAGIASRVSATSEIFERTHVHRVLNAWFNKRTGFNPFKHNDNIRDHGDESIGWEHWMREGPERFGTISIDQHFFGK